MSAATLQGRFAAAGFELGVRRLDGEEPRDSDATAIAAALEGVDADLDALAQIVRVLFPDGTIDLHRDMGADEIGEVVNLLAWTGAAARVLGACGACNGRGCADCPTAEGAAASPPAHPVAVAFLSYTIAKP